MQVEVVLEFMEPGPPDSAVLAVGGMEARQMVALVLQEQQIQAVAEVVDQPQGRLDPTTVVLVDLVL
jgi:hypothetical protein